MISPPTRQRSLKSGPPTYQHGSSDADPPSYSLSSGSGSGSSSSSPSNSPSAPPLVSPDAIVPAFPLLDRLADPLSPSSRHLPHLVASALTLTLTKQSIQIVLAENPVFISPPKVDAFGLSDTDYGIEGEEGGKDVSPIFTLSHDAVEVQLWRRGAKLGRVHDDSSWVRVPTDFSHCFRSRY